MNRYRRYLPIAAVLLIALGVNLDQFGIDLESIARGGGASTEGSVSQGSDARRSESGATADSSGHATVERLPHWSSTEPNINLRHVFQGEINRRGSPVGFHSRPDGRDPDGARVVSLNREPNDEGVYTASVEIRDGGQWKQKDSSFFPDSLSIDEVVDVILAAYRNSPNPDAQPFEGPSGLGFQIQGYTSSRGGINTAYPIYR